MTGSGPVHQCPKCKTTDAPNYPNFQRTVPEIERFNSLYGTPLLRHSKIRSKINGILRWRSATHQAIPRVKRLAPAARGTLPVGPILRAGKVRSALQDAFGPAPGNLASRFRDSVERAQNNHVRPEMALEVKMDRMTSIQEFLFSAPLYKQVQSHSGTADQSLQSTSSESGWLVHIL